MPEFTHQGKDKKEFVRRMFDDISPHYDFLNHFLSLGIDIYWRKKFIHTLNIQDGQTILDVACGTGDIGFEILKQHKIELLNLDLSKKMLDIAEKKAQDKRLENIQFIHGDAEMLPLENNSVDCLTIAYGFRNIAHYEKALEEFYRVLKPGGTFVILETSVPTKFPFKQGYKVYSKYILPTIGKLFSKDKTAYKYLSESASVFPYGEALNNILRNIGFINVQDKPQTFGVATIYIASKS